MNFRDFFRSSFLENITSFSTLDALIAMVLALGIGIFIFIVYRKTFSGVMYSTSFGISLVAMTLITTLIILAVTSNIILSLGMVGALSIVRFRTAIKDPLDIVFLFWSLAAGIILGAGLLPLAVFGSIFIGIVLVLFANRKTTDTPYMLIIRCSDDQAEKTARQYIANKVKKGLVKSKTVTVGSGVELAMEVRLIDGATDFVNEMAKHPGIKDAVLVSYNGEYME
ncbi:MAG TPA: DUF4956 domain-containing protein [Thermotogota bacterium]|mgnify:FL=1|jgi:uncharacterized membrane protein YhiD involved in acid resistance|nr:DUF4956 domain-containing protein [Thermotogota bacterium]HPB87558.1 DUF4956 domain-containing protein [Thermotogota bacterium]HQN22243.1 DUF4956 domain-containing protein [Thermotogota bacterium]HQQ66212.1 DUF4956 domain-containing protein [Thermotogota bacterium]